MWLTSTNTQLIEVCIRSFLQSARQAADVDVMQLSASAFGWKCALSCSESDHGRNQIPSLFSTFQEETIIMSHTTPHRTKNISQTFSQKSIVPCRLTHGGSGGWSPSAKRLWDRLARNAKDFSQSDSQGYHAQLHGLVDAFLWWLKTPDPT